MEIITALCLGQSVKLHTMLDISYDDAEACCAMYRSISRRFQLIARNYTEPENRLNWYWLHREFQRAENGILKFLRLLEANHGAESPQLVINFDPPEIPPSANFWEKAEKQNG